MRLIDSNVRLAPPTLLLVTALAWTAALAACGDTQVPDDGRMGGDVVRVDVRADASMPDVTRVDGSGGDAGDVASTDIPAMDTVDADAPVPDVPVPDDTGPDVPIVDSVCTPDCTGRACGPDSCGGSCGACATGTSCSSAGSCVAGCVPTCGGRGCGTNGCTGSCGTCAAGEACDAAGRCAPTATDCPIAGEVVIYTQGGWNLLADAFRADPSPCANYFISIPAVAGNKSYPRGGGEAAAMRARGARFHAAAEFHWTTWAAVAGMTWYEKGVEFRRRMTAAGYDVSAGDGWAINELPSSVRSDTTVRRAVRDVVRGLHDGPSGSPTSRGIVFIVGMGQATTNFAVYKPNLRDWLSDAPFWTDMNSYVRFWSQEVYANPDFSCVGGTTVAQRSTSTNEYVQHVARHANAGGAVSATSQSYLNRAYVPLMNAVWRAAAYNTTTMSLDQMQHFASTQVYASRAWATSNPYPDGRIGFAWDLATGETDADRRTLAARLASAIHHAYGVGGGGAARACSPSGAFTWCQCVVAGAAFNPGWSTFATW